MTDSTVANKDSNWRERESSRQYEGRIMPVWHRELWWQPWNLPEGTRDHYCHVSATDSKFLAYTQDSDKGERDIQTQIKPGKYLTKYFGGVLTAKQIKYYATWQVTGKREYIADAWGLAFTNTSDGISDVYREGPKSCMTFKHRSTSEHPCRVYAAGDLALAYLTDDKGKVRARALVWPEQKIFGRVYPNDYNWKVDGFASLQESVDCASSLENRLIELGFSFDTESTAFVGAKLQKIDSWFGGYVMPYLDHGYNVSDNGDHFIMCRYGDYNCSGLNGTVGEDQEEHEYTCDNCDDGIDDYTTVYTGVTRRNGFLHGRYSQAWCDHCRDNYAFWCEATEEYYSDSEVESARVGDMTVCLAWAEIHCFLSDYDGEWFYHDDESPVVLENGDTWSESEFEQHGFTCKVTSIRASRAEMHPDIEGVHCDVTENEYQAWLAIGGDVDRDIIYDRRQVEMPLTHDVHGAARMRLTQ